MSWTISEDYWAEPSEAGLCSLNEFHVSVSFSVTERSQGVVHRLSPRDCAEGSQSFELCWEVGRRMPDLGLGGRDGPRQVPGLLCSWAAL